MKDNFVVVLKDNKNTPGTPASSVSAVFEGSPTEIIAWMMTRLDVSIYEIFDPEDRQYLSVKNFITAHNVLKFVPKYYRMNPKTDELIPNGSGLKNGMRVLIEEPNKRVNTDEDLDNWEEDRALESNRWCTVEALQVDPTGVSFVGVYDDGTKRSRRCAGSHAWLVRKDSIPGENAKTEQLNTIIVSAMAAAININNSDRSTKSKELELGKKVVEAVKKIQELQ
jgi:hypothetical protein